MESEQSKKFKFKKALDILPTFSPHDFAKYVRKNNFAQA